MFFNAPPQPTKAKHVVYLIAATILGLLLSLIAHAVIEHAYLQSVIDEGKAVHWYGGCALHPVIQIGLLLIGALGGFSLGRLWWRMVYIERKWAKGIVHSEREK